MCLFTKTAALDLRGKPETLEKLFLFADLASAVVALAECVILLLHGKIASLGSGATKLGILLSFMLMLILYVMNLLKYSAGKFFVRRHREMQPKPPEPPEPSELLSEDFQTSDSKMEKSYLEVYERLVEYFEKEEPYLNMDLNINDVARTLLTNKVYISKAVNMFSHRNFCQFVNIYRVKYALKIFEQDPNVKLNELSRMAGFRTVATFNMAFKLHLNQSPGEWSRKRRMMLKTPYKF